MSNDKHVEDLGSLECEVLVCFSAVKSAPKSLFMAASGLSVASICLLRSFDFPGTFFPGISAFGCVYICQGIILKLSPGA